MWTNKYLDLRNILVAELLNHAAHQRFQRFLALCYVALVHLGFFKLHQVFGLELPQMDQNLRLVN